MTVPLMVLAALSLFAGVLNPGFGFKYQPMEHWLEPVFKAASEGTVLYGKTNDKEWAEHMVGALATGGVLAFAVGTAIAYWMYMMQKGEPAKRLALALPGVHRTLLNKWYVDEIYDFFPIGGIDALAETSAAADRTLVDGILARLTSLVVAASGTILRTFQTGVVHVYAALMVVGLAAVGLFFALPHSGARVSDAGNDDYVVTAAPGVGYAYRWDADGDDKPDKPDFTDGATLKLHVPAGKSQTVHLEVKNAFGLVSRKTIKLERQASPSAPLTSL